MSANRGGRADSAFHPRTRAFGVPLPRTAWELMAGELLASPEVGVGWP